MVGRSGPPSVSLRWRVAVSGKGKLLGIVFTIVFLALALLNSDRQGLVDTLTRAD